MTQAGLHGGPCPTGVHCNRLPISDCLSLPTPLSGVGAGRCGCHGQRLPGPHLPGVLERLVRGRVLGGLSEGRGEAASGRPSHGGACVRSRAPLQLPLPAYEPFLVRICLGCTGRTRRPCAPGTLVRTCDATAGGQPCCSSGRRASRTAAQWRACEAVGDRPLCCFSRAVQI